MKTSYEIAQDILRIYQDTNFCLNNKELNKRKEFQNGVPTKEYLTSQLEEIRNTFNNFEWSKKEQELSITTKPVILGKINFGKFKIVLKFMQRKERNFENRDFSVSTFLGDTNLVVYGLCFRNPKPKKTVEERVRKNELRFIRSHPHLGENKNACLGNATFFIRKSLDICNFYGFFEIAEIFIHSYNRKDPYVSLSEYKLHSCRLCLKKKGYRNLIVCSECNRIYCKDCAKETSIGDIICHHCLKDNEKVS